MKLRPDTSPLVDLSRHRTRREYEQSSWLREIARALVLFVFGAALVAGWIWAVLTFNPVLP